MPIHTAVATLHTNHGDIVVNLFGDQAPKTVQNFVGLSDGSGSWTHPATGQPGEGPLYTDVIFHRIIPDFMAQCGDPTGTGSGGPGYSFADEVDGSETYPAGTLAMANTGAPDSGGSQFFIVYGDTQLPPQYTVFGTVDAAGIKAITQAAKAGVEPQMGPEDGAPKTPIDLTTVSLG